MVLCTSLISTSSLGAVGGACAPGVTIEFKSASIDRVKRGYDAFIPSSSPKVPKFRRLEDSFEESVQLLLDGVALNGRGTALYRHVYDPASDQYSHSESGHISVSGAGACEADLSDATHADCFLSFTEVVDRFRSEWGGAFDNQEPCATTWDDDSPTTPTRYTVRTGHYVLSCEGRSGFHHFSSVRTLSEEYRTDEFIGNVQADLRLQTYPGDWEGANEARMTIDTTETEAVASKARFRFQIRQTERDTTYVVQWDEVTMIENGGTWVRKLQEEIEGTGRATFGVEHEVLPPDQNGVRSIQNVSISIRQVDPLSIPGSGGPVGLGGDGCDGCPGELGTMSGGGVLVSLGLGRTKHGQSAGQIMLSLARPSTTLAHPGVLFYTGHRSDVTVVRMNDAIRQVKAPQALVDVVVMDPSRYQIRYYLPSQAGAPSAGGVHPVTGAPFVIWTIERLVASETANERLRVSETRGDAIKDYTYSFDGLNNSWKLAYPGGAREDESVSVAVGATREQIRIVRDGSGNPTSRVKETYRMFAWGEALVELKEGDDPHAKTTTFNYSNQGFASGNVLPLEEILRPDGSWERYRYDDLGRKTVVGSSFGDQAPTSEPSLCRMMTFDYTPVSGTGDDGTIDPFAPRLVVESLLGREISRHYLILRPGEKREIRCQTPGASWDAADNLSTITRFHQTGGHVDKVQSVKKPDGTMEIYDYVDQGSAERTTVSSGQPNSGQTAIVNGTRSITLRGEVGQLLSRIVVDIASNATMASEVSGNFDEFQRPRRVTYLDGTITETSFACCGIDSTIDRDGTATQFWYDGLKRPVGSTRNNITLTNFVDASGRVRVTKRIGSDGSEIMLRSLAFDLAGRITSETNALQGVTRYTEISDGLGRTVKTTTFHDGGVRIDTYARDGALVRVTGTAVHPVRYEYGVEDESGVARAYSREIKLDANGADTMEWVKTYTDMLGRSYKTVFAAAAGSPAQVSLFNARGQLEGSTDPDGVATLFQYNAKGDLEFTATDLDRNGRIDFAGTDRITQSIRDVAVNSGALVQRVREFSYPTNSSNVPVLLSSTEASVTGLRTWHNRFGLIGRTEGGYDRSNGLRFETNVAPDRASVIRVYRHGALESETRRDASGSQLGRTTYGYDSHGRIETVTDARTGETRYGYNEADQITRITTPAPGPDQNASTRTVRYNPMLQPWQVTEPDGATVTREFYLTGELKRSYGSGNYPVEYAYDAQGRLKSMTTWSNFASGAGARITTWNYDLHRGWLRSKRYPDETGPDYEYTLAGRLEKRTWARGNPRVTTSYRYDGAGDLQSVLYDDGVTRDLQFSRDRLGRVSRVLQGDSSSSLNYHPSGGILAESSIGGVMDGLVVTNSYDSLLRRASVAVNTHPSTLTAFLYDSASRLQIVTNAGWSATYSYLANSPLLEQTIFKQGSAVRLTATKKHDPLNRLNSIANSMPGFAASAHVYQYNEADQRVRATLLDQSYWAYEYDALGQVKGGKRYWSDDAAVPGEQFEYVHDDIGNRLATRVGGDASGGSLRSASYAPNQLNQYLSRTVPGAVDIAGIGHGSAAITVNGQAASRHNEFYHAVVTANNQTAAAYPSATVEATLDGKVLSQTGKVFLPRDPEEFAYDADGNLKRDGRWIYTWDAENRLIQMEARPDIPDAARKRIEFTYDYEGRRIRKTVSVWNSSTLNFERSTDVKFVYDGWNLLAELEADNRLIQSYTWGLDLSGTMQGAGGVGGLLAIRPAGGTPHFAAYDGNGNVTALIDGASGTVSAQYEYGPFGEPIRVTGTMGKGNPFRFSTKYWDDESDLSYFGRRHYHPSLGRWLSRDPMSEEAGANLYGFVRNAPTGTVDYLGLYEIDFHYYVIYYLLRAKCFTGDEADILAGFSQGIDDNPETEPIVSSPQTRALYHFPGSGPQMATSGDDPGARAQLKRAFSRCGCEGIKLDRTSYNIGAALHAYADSFSHEGFTGWHNTTINIRTGGFFPNVGHADADERGHAPDLPYMDLPKAMRAARKIYELIPDRCLCSTGTAYLWSEIAHELQNSIVAHRDERERVKAIYELIKRRFREAPIYDKSKYSQIPRL